MGHLWNTASDAESDTQTTEIQRWRKRAQLMFERIFVQVDPRSSFVAYTVGEVQAVQPGTISLFPVSPLILAHVALRYRAHERHNGYLLYCASDGCTVLLDTAVHRYVEQVLPNRERNLLVFADQCSAKLFVDVLRQRCTDGTSS